MTILTLRVDKKTLKKLDELAKQRGITRSQLLREAINLLFSPYHQQAAYSHPYYDPLISQLLERISKLEMQVQMLMSQRITPTTSTISRPKTRESAQAKELVIERTVTRAIVGSTEDMKDLLDNPWAEILQKKGKDRG